MHNVDRAENEMQNTSTGLDLGETQSVRDGAWRMKLRETGSNWDGTEKWSEMYTTSTMYLRRQHTTATMVNNHAAGLCTI